MLFNTSLLLSSPNTTTTSPTPILNELTPVAVDEQIFFQTAAARGISGIFVWLSLIITCHQFSTPELMAGRPLRSRGALVLCAVALGLAPSFVAQGLSRRHVGFLASGLILGTSQDAKAAVEVTQADKERLTRGYKELVYMMKNFNTVTRKCEKNQENIQRALQSGQASPDGCIANPLVVRKYLGQTSIKADLFNTKDLLVNMELAGMVPSKSEDEYGDLVEDFEAFKRQVDEWAYSSSWAEANPGGGRDRTEDYLLRSKSLADKATKTLGRIVEILGLSENLYA